MISEAIWEDIQGIYQDCYDLGLGHPDSHAGNVGQIDGHLIFYDVFMMYLIIVEMLMILYLRLIRLI